MRFPLFATPLALLIPALTDVLVLGQEKDRLLDLKPEMRLDESLFLMRVLEKTYLEWPSASAENVVLTTWVRGTRLRLAKFKKNAELDKLDADIIKLYAEAIELLEQYDDFLVRIGAIRHANGGDGEEVSIAIDSISKGFGVAEFAMALGAGGPAGLATGGLIALGNGIYELWKKNNRDRELNEAARRNLEAQAKQINDRFRERYEVASLAAEKLARPARHGWGDAVGFNGSHKLPPAAQIKARPTDPFALLLQAERDPGKTSAAMLARSRDCVKAARLIPEGRVYDPLRAECLAVAIRLARSAAAEELASNNPAGFACYSAGPARCADEGIRIARTYLDLMRDDPGKFGQMELARLLGCAGRYEEAIAAANAARKNFERDPLFALRYACLMSLTNRVDNAAEWLEYAYKCGYDDAAEVRIDPDFKALREKKPDTFKRLSEPKWSWRVDYGDFFDDDIILTNHSPFALTNVTLNCTIKKGDREWTPGLKVKYLGAGQSHKWEDVINVPGGKAESESARLECDQIRK